MILDAKWSRDFRTQNQFRAKKKGGFWVFLVRFDQYGPFLFTFAHVAVFPRNF